MPQYPLLVDSRWFQDMTAYGLTPADAAASASVREPTARKWLGRYPVGGEAARAYASSRPGSSRRRISAFKALAVIALRLRRLTQARIAASLACSAATVNCVLRRAGLAKLSSLQPAEPV